MVDGLFTCQRHTGELRITATTCASMWARARRNREEDRIRLAPCMGCEVGAANAGEPASTKAAPGKGKPASVGQTCCRCGKGGRRLVLGHTLCISCFNRQREYQAGRNAKGGPTRDHRPLFCAVVGVSSAAGAVTPMAIDWVGSTLEAMLVIQRSTGRSRFGRTTSNWRDALPFRPAKPQQAEFLVGTKSRPDAAPTA